MQQLTIDENKEGTAATEKTPDQVWDGAAAGGNPGFVMEKTRGRPTGKSGPDSTGAGWGENDAQGWGVNAPGGGNDGQDWGNDGQDWGNDGQDWGNDGQDWGNDGQDGENVLRPH